MQEMTRYKKHALVFVILFVLTAHLDACGRKGALIPPGTVLPAAVGDLHAEPRAERVILSWTAPSENQGGTSLSDLAGFDVLRAELAGDEEDCDCEYYLAGTVDLEMPEDALVKGGRVVWADPSGSLVHGRRYGYKVVPYNTGGYRGGESNTASLVFLPSPPAPQGLTAEPSDTLVRLNWQAVPQPGAELAGYNLYRAASSGEPMKRPLNSRPVTETSYTDTGLENGKKFVYRVTALVGSSPPYSEGPPSEDVGAVPVDNIAPEAPSGLQAVPAEGGVLISWLPSMDQDVTGYILYRKGAEDEGFGPLRGMPVKGITFKDKDVQEGLTYTYAVSALDDAEPPNESGRSDAVSVSIPTGDTR